MVTVTSLLHPSYVPVDGLTGIWEVLEGLQENKNENMLSPLMSGSVMDIGPSLKAKGIFLTSC